MSTFQQPTINGTAPGDESRKVCTQEVGWMFAKQYYNMMNSDPSRLYMFYGKKSTFIQGTEGVVVKQANGQQEIRAAIAASDFKDCRVAVSNVDTLPAIGDGILIQVLGKISFGDQAPRDFCQTFLLAEQPGGYYLHNNILRYLKEVDDEPEAVGTEPVAIAAPVEASVPPAAAKPAAAVPKDEKVDTSEDAKKDAVVAAPKEAVVAEPSAPDSEAKPVAAVAEEKPAVVSSEADTKPKTARVNPAAAEKPVSEEAPKTEKLAAPVPSKPTSWANLAASESNKWGSKMANIEGTVAPAAQMQTASPESSSRVSTPASGTRDSRRRNEALSVFLKNIPQTATTTAIKDAFSAFGPVASIDYAPHKTTSIVEFSSEAAKQKALRAGSVTVLANRVVIEERRSRSDTKQRRDGGSNKQPSGPPARNGSGEFERVGSGRGSRSRTSTTSGGNASNRPARGGKQ